MMKPLQCLRKAVHLLLLASAPVAASAQVTDGVTTGVRRLEVRSTVQPLSPMSRSSGFTHGRDYLADPEILHHEGRYYLYGTTSDSANFTGEENVGLGVRCYSSPDLYTWQDEGLALNANSEEHCPYTRMLIWSPQVIHAHGAFYLFYNAIGTEYDEAKKKGTALGGSHYQRLCVARSDSPKGPFTEHKAPLFTGAAIPGYIDGEKGVIGTLDAFVYTENSPTDPRYYLYWSGINDEQNENLMWGGELRADFTGLRLPAEGGAEPRMVLGTPLQEWEKQSCGERKILEAPSILHRGDLYYLLYSANSFNTIPYAVGYATAPHPLGPYTRGENNPVLSTGDVEEADYLSGQIIGTAGASFVDHPSGEPLLTFAAIDSATTVPLCSNDAGHARRPYLTRYEIKANGELSIVGPK